MQLTEHEVLSAEPEIRPARRRTRRQRSLPPAIGSLFAAIALVIVFTSTVSLENHLPSLRIAEPPAAGVATTVLEPGSYQAEDPAIVRTGNWFPQTLGSTSSTETSTSLVSSTPGSTMTLVFYGTELNMDARIGPESGKIRVSIDGEPSEVLPADDQGSFVDLGSDKAKETTILLATGLSHHDHTLVIETASDADVAISQFHVSASTPFPWAFTILYSGLAMLLFVVVRSAVIVMSEERGWLR